MHMTQSVRVVGACLGDRSGVTVELLLTVQRDTEQLDLSRDGQRRSSDCDRRKGCGSELQLGGSADND